MCNFSLAGLLLCSLSLFCILGLCIFLGFQGFPKFKGMFSVPSKVHAGTNAFSKVALLENRLAGINDCTFQLLLLSYSHGFEKRNIYYCVSPTFHEEKVPAHVVIVWRRDITMKCVWGHTFPRGTHITVPLDSTISKVLVDTRRSAYTQTLPYPRYRPY